MSYKDNIVSVVVVAAGMGKRMKSEINKTYLMIKNKPILAHTLGKFEKNKYVDEIVLVVKEDEINYCRENIVNKYSLTKVKKIIPGGNERQDSVYNGLKNVNEKCSIVLIHDGARPFISNEEVNNIIKNTLTDKACVLGVRVKDTIKTVDIDNNIIDTPNRENLWAVHTPQAFHYDLILSAHERCKKEKWIVTDDSSIVEKLGVKVRLIEGSYNNIKITTPEDLIIANDLLNGEEITIMSKREDMTLLYAVDANWGIGYKNDLLVKISEDLKDFKKLTTGNIIIMGRKTFESLPDSKPLPNRMNIVITRDKSYSVEGIEVVHSIDELFDFLKKVDPNEEKRKFVIGGGEIGRQLLPYCDMGYITKIFKSFENVDTKFPDLDVLDDWKIARESSVRRQDDLEYKYVEYHRIK